MRTFLIQFVACVLCIHVCVYGADSRQVEFFERNIRPILVNHCYECHSEAAQSREGGLLLDREIGWLQGGHTGKAVVPGDAAGSLLITAVSYSDDKLQMPPEKQLDENQIQLLTAWVAAGGTGGHTDPGTTEFSRLGDQDYLFEQAKKHWAFRPLAEVSPPASTHETWNDSAIDRFVIQRLSDAGLHPAEPAANRTLVRRLHFDLTGLPSTMNDVLRFEADAARNRREAIEELVEKLITSEQFGAHMATLWLDVARYADTDSSYRPDTRTPHYFPFAFTYRDYVVDAFNADKPYDQFVKEQLAADLMGFAPSAPETAALGFLATGPHANRNATESIDDWIDVTTRGLMGLTVACARCHDHKYEPVPTSDYYALHGVFASIRRINELDEAKLPQLAHYQTDGDDLAAYTAQRSAIEQEIRDAAGKKARGNNRSISQKIRETKLAELLLFHPGAPVHTMVVEETGNPVDSSIAIRGDVSNRGDRISRRFLQVLDPDMAPFSVDNSGRLALAERIVSPDNPLTARVFVNRIWGLLMGTHIVATPSDFGLQAAEPTHPELLDNLAMDFIRNGWSVKHLVRRIVLSQTYQQRSDVPREHAARDPGNRLLSRANRKRLTIEAIRDSMLFVSQQLDHRPGGRAAALWGKDYSVRRSVYGFVNRFNLDPTLRAHDFPARMQTTGGRGESIVAPQALFTMNSAFAVDQAVAVTELSEFMAAADDDHRIDAIFSAVLQRRPDAAEKMRITRFLEQQRRFFETPRKNSTVTSPWPLVAQSLMMSNEFQYVD